MIYYFESFYQKYRNVLGERVEDWKWKQCEIIYQKTKIVNEIRDVREAFTFHHEEGTNHSVPGKTCRLFHRDGWERNQDRSAESYFVNNIIPQLMTVIYTFGVIKPFPEQVLSFIYALFLVLLRAYDIIIFRKLVLVKFTSLEDFNIANNIIKANDIKAIK